MGFSVELPLLGTLVTEQIFYILGQNPILFVCTNKEGARYLCSCCKLSEEWVISKVSNDMLMALMDDRIAIRAVFKTSGNPIFFARWDGKQFTVFQPAPDNALPLKGALLELGDKVADYRQKLKNSEKES